MKLRLDNIAGYPDADSYVDAKIEKFNNSDISFATMYEFMFSEKENILFEQSKGYRIIKKTYGESYNDIERIAKRICAYMSKNPGAHERTSNVIGIHMDNRIEWIEIMWAILKAGYSPLLMNTRLDKKSLENALSDTKAILVITDSEKFSVDTIVYTELLDDDVANVNADDMSYSWGEEILVMSSGTSQSIKVCSYSAEEFHHQINDSCKIISESHLIKIHYEGELKLLTFLPFYHIFGLFAVYIWFAFFSRTFVLLNDFKPKTILDTIRRHKVTHIFTVPLFWEQVYKQAIKQIKNRGEDTYNKFLKGMSISNKLGNSALGKMFKKKAFSEVRANIFGDSIVFLITGGSKIDKEVLEFFNGIGYHLANGYGMTELGITSVELSNSSKKLNSSSVGTPLTSVEYRINDNGELLVKSKAAARYIIENGVRREREEWFNTRDLATCSDDSYRILGRMDDVVIASNGENLNPDIIEGHFQIEEVEQVCLVAFHDEIPTLVICVDKHITKEKKVRIDSKIKEAIIKNNLDGLINKIIYTVTPLMNENEFKVNRGIIRRKLDDGELQELDFDNIPQGEEPDNEVVDNLKRITADILGKSRDSISTKDDFFLELEGTSLDYFALVSRIEEEYGIKIELTEDNPLKSVNDFYRYIEDNA